MNIILIGYRGSGKSTVGRRLAARLGMRFIDTDDLIQERQGVPILEIVKSQGWDHFRKLERTIIEEVSNGDYFIIAPGGGAVLDTDNVKALKRNGLMIWLKADPQILLQRMNQDPETNSRRPALTGKGALEEIQETLFMRKPFYESASKFQIDTSASDVEEVVETILTLLPKPQPRS